MVKRAGKRRLIDMHCLRLLLGYGMFRSLMGCTYSSAMSTVGNLSPVSAANLEFSLASSAAVIATCIALVAMGCLRPKRRLVGSGLAAAGVLVCTNLCSQLGALSGLMPGALVALLACVWGLTCIVANAAWLIPFTELGARRCLTTLIASVLISSACSLAAGLLPSGARAAWTTCLGAASMALFWTMSRTPDPVRARHDDGRFVLPAAPRVAFGQTLGLLGELAGPLVIYASLTMLSGFSAAFMTPAEVPAAALPTYSIASLAGIALLAAAAFVSNRMFDLMKTFQAAFPLIALMLAVLPFADAGYGLFFQSALTFLSAIVNVSMLFMLLETARVRAVPAVAATASCMLIARLALLASLAIGAAAGERIGADDTLKALVLVIVGIYLLSMTLAFLTRRPAAQRTGDLDVSVPLGSDEVSFNRPEGVSADELKAHKERERTAARIAQDVAAQADPQAKLASRAAQLAQERRLTAREQEVIVLLAQGRSAPYIAQDLGLATNTVRGYVQEAYAKLDVHSKQELIDLLTH